jgi:hypothetical protein
LDHAVAEEARRQDLRAFSDYMTRNFATASWWTSLDTIELDHHAVVLIANTDNCTMMSRVCAAASSFVFSSQNTTRIRSLQVRDPDGHTRVERPRPDEPRRGACNPAT